MTRRKRASAGHITSPRCESLPMVSGSTREHDGAHDRDEISRAADERSKGSARRHARACAGRAGKDPHRRASLPRRRGTKMASQGEEWPSPSGLDPGTLCDPSPHYCSHLGAQLDRPPLALRARVFASRRSLDDALADGASPLWTPELALRARQLVCRASRQQLATSLERLVKQAQRSVSPARRRRAPSATRDSGSATCLLNIAACLLDERPVYARGIALLSRLLSEGSGPAYNQCARESLRNALEGIATALDGQWRTRQSA
jgi:hypothetical protein